tara:strand:- start:1262 stop:3919 length:2658 start_codon:yes stop_codon:yes gene_type:complete
MDIFDSRQQRELQRLRQSQASSIVGIDPNLKGFTQRFDPDVSRMSLLKAQRERLPTKAELEKSAGVKTIKKLKKRKKKNLRGEVARNLREQRRFEKGERRDKPEQEPRIVGDPIPAVPGAAAAPVADPNAQLRLAIEGRRIASQDAQQRRLVDALMDRDDRERGERQLILDRQADERQALVGRSEVERRSILDREFAERREASGERDRILQGSERERVELRGAFRTILESETDYARQERQDIREQSEAERRVVRREGREESTALRDRVDQQIIDERRKAAEERGQLFERGITALERFGDEERRERVQREDQQAAAQVAERQRQRQESESSAGRSQLERETILGAAAEERESLLRLSLESQREPVPEGQTEADRNFISRQFQSGLDTIDRRIGEAEARTTEQIRHHADRVAAVERQPPIIIQQPAQPAQPTVQQGPTAAEIASSVRSQLQEIDTNTPVSPTARRINIEEQSEEETPVSSPRPIETPQSTGQEIDFGGGGGEERGEPEPEVDLSGDEPVGSGELLRQGEFLEVGKRLLGGATSTKNTAINKFYGIDSSANPSVAAQVVGGGEVVSEPAQVPSERIAELEQEEEGTPSFGPRPVTPPRSFPAAIPTGDPEQKPRKFAAPLAARPEGVAPLPPPELEGSGVFIDPSNLPQEGGQDLFQSGQFSGDLEAAAQNAIGFVGDIAGRAAGGISSLVNPDTPVGEQTGGALVDAKGKPIFGLGQEIEEPTIKPLASSSPRRRPKIESRSAPPRVETTGTTGRGLVESEEDGEAEGVQPQLRRTNYQTYEALRSDLDQSYVRGRPKGGSRDFVPFKITNTSDRKFKGLEPGRSVSIAQVEGDGKLGYFPTGRVDKSKAGITRIGRGELEKQIKAGKLKIDRSGAE